MTAFHPDAALPKAKVRVLRVDPRTVAPAGSAGTTADTPTIVTFVAPRTARPRRRARRCDALVRERRVPRRATGEPATDATTLADGVSLASPAAAAARAAVGVQDEDGMLDWIELAPEVPASATTASVLDALLARAGCSSRMLVTGDPHALLGGTLDLAAQPFEAAVGATAARLVRGAAPGAHLAFESTPIVPPAVWQPLESQRVRYFRRAPKKASSVAQGRAAPLPEPERARPAFLPPTHPTAPPPGSIPTLAAPELSAATPATPPPPPTPPNAKPPTRPPRPTPPASPH